MVARYYLPAYYGRYGDIAPDDFKGFRDRETLFFRNILLGRDILWYFYFLIRMEKTQISEKYLLKREKTLSISRHDIYYYPHCEYREYEGISSRRKPQCRYEDH
jgi:hypothetical protein